MSRYSILLIVFFILTSCGSQYKEKLFYKNMSCVKQDKLAVTERNKIYPYCKSSAKSGHLRPKI